MRGGKEHLTLHAKHRHDDQGECAGFFTWRTISITNRSIDDCRLVRASRTRHCRGACTPFAAAAGGRFLRSAEIVLRGFATMNQRPRWSTLCDCGRPAPPSMVHIVEVAGCRSRAFVDYLSPSIEALQHDIFAGVHVVLVVVCSNFKGLQKSVVV